MRTRALWLFAVAALVVIALLGAGDADAAGWLAAVLVSPPPASGSTAAPGVFTDPGGDQVITWENIDPNGETCSSQTVASRVSGGDFVQSDVPCGYLVTLSPTGVVYAYGLGGGSISERSAPAGQMLPTSDTAVGPLEGPNGDVLEAGNIEIRFDSAGGPTVVYGTGDLSTLPNTWEFAASTPNPDGSWTAQVISQTDLTDPSFEAQVAPDGSAVVVWPDAGAIDYVRRDAGGSTWTVPLGAATGNEMVLLPDPQNRFTLVYQAGAYPTATGNAITMSNTGVWGSVEAMPMASGYSANLGKLAIDSLGNASATWWEVSGGSTCCLVGAFARASGSNTWTDAGSDLYDVTFSTSFKGLDLSIDPHDTATIALKLDSGTQYFTRAAGAAAFTPASAPSTPPGSNSPALSEDPQGYLVATWVDGTGAVYSAVYDPVPPTIDSVAPPSAPVAGQPASFTVGGSDVWGPVSFTVDFGDGQSANGRALARALPSSLRARSASATVQHTYAQAGTYNATITVADGAGNSAATSRSVTVAQAPATTTSSPAPTPLPPVTAGLPDPVLGRTANVAPVRPVVRIKAPGSRVFVPLTAPAQIKIGSLIDTRKGRVRITVANGHGGLSTADFYEGLFKLTQKRTGSKLATLLLQGGSFKGCPRAPRPQLARVRSKSRSVRHLWGSGNGAFRTVGRFSAASIRGTTWKTDDRCNGTLTLVTQGKVAVRDFVKRRTVVVRARHRYFARPR